MDKKDLEELELLKKEKELKKLRKEKAKEEKKRKEKKFTNKVAKYGCAPILVIFILSVVITFCASDGENTTKSHKKIEKELGFSCKSHITNGNGTVKCHYDNGQLAAIENWRNYKMHGESAEYYSNGNIEKIGNIVNDYREGEWLFYNKSGNLINIECYRAGDIISCKK